MTLKKLIKIYLQDLKPSLDCIRLFIYVAIYFICMFLPVVLFFSEKIGFICFAILQLGIPLFGLLFITFIASYKKYKREIK